MAWIEADSGPADEGQKVMLGISFGRTLQAVVRGKEGSDQVQDSLRGCVWVPNRKSWLRCLKVGNCQIYYGFWLNDLWHEEPAGALMDMLKSRYIALRQSEQFLARCRGEGLGDVGLDVWIPCHCVCEVRNKHLRPIGGQKRAEIWLPGRAESICRQPFSWWRYGKSEPMEDLVSELVRLGNTMVPPG